MAENEILDVGNPRRYKKWRIALSDPSLSPEQIADCLRDEFVSITRKSLQGTPLYLILQACGKDRTALHAAIDSCKNRDLACKAEKAFLTTQSRNIYVLAEKIAGMLVDSLQDKVRLYALKYADGMNSQKLESLESATASRLRACKAEVIEQLMASLRNKTLPKLKRPLSRRKPKSVQALSDTSLLKPEQRPTGVPDRV